MEASVKFLTLHGSITFFLRDAEFKTFMKDLYFEIP